MSEVLEYEFGENITDNRKTEEINIWQNYRKTLRWAEDELRNDRKFSLSFLKEMHNMLTCFYRGKKGHR